MMRPTASVILPTFNGARTLKRAIDSVLGQTFQDFELIIVDDGSTDETIELLRAYSGERKIRVISQPRRGVAGARNVGVRMSQGRYLAFQDSDDEWMPDKLDKAINTLESCGPEVGLFYTDMLRVEADNSCVYFHLPDVQKGRLIDEARLDYQTYIGMQAVVMRRECLDRAGLFDESLSRFEDLELLIRVSEHFEFFHHKEALVKYYAGEGLSTDREALIFARQYLIDKYREGLSEHKHHLLSQQLLLTMAIQDAQIAEKCRLIESLPALATEGHGTVWSLATVLAEKHQIALALVEQVGERQSQIDSLAAQLGESQNTVAALTAQVSGQEAELTRMKRTLGWRLLTPFGKIKYQYLKIKYQYLLPIHRQLKLGKKYNTSYRETAVRLWRSFRLFSFDFLPSQGRAKQLYTAFGDENSLCVEGLYLNLGYWKHAPKNLDEAGSALADLLAKTVQLGPEDEVLDVGFGFGDQDFFWHDTYHPAKITGVNVTPVQVRVARARAEQRGLSDSISFRKGDATRLPFPNAHFTVVFAMECAFHFRTREAFLREAFRVLKPGGRLALADFSPTPNMLAHKNHITRLVRRRWQIPEENMYPSDIYQAKVAAAGFSNVNLQSIWHDVVPPFWEFARVRLADAELARRMNPVLLQRLMISMKAPAPLSPLDMDYVLVQAEKIA